MNNTEGVDRLKKPKAKWAAYAKAELEIMGMTYDELSERINESTENVRQVFSKDNQPNVRKKICEYLGVSED